MSSDLESSWWDKQRSGKVPVWLVVLLAVLVVAGAVAFDSDGPSADGPLADDQQELAVDDSGPATTGPTTTVPTTTVPTTTVPTTTVPTTTVPSDDEVPVEPSPFLLTLGALTIADEGPRLGYDRNDWPHWADTNGSGCDSREDLLQLYGSDVEVDVDESCSVTSGRWYSWYDGVTTTDPSSFDADHIVSLAEAHDSGGAQWSRDQKREFANDSTNLVLVSASSNRSKGDRDVAEWKPAVEVWCITATQIVSVKYNFGLSVDPAEYDSLEEMLGTCGRADQVSWWDSEAP